MGRLRRKRMHKPTKDVKKKYRTRRRTKDLDQIHQDLKPENKEKLLKQDENVDLPGLGHYYCVECARYFVTEVVLTRHQESKLHKKRVKELKEAPYTQKEAEAAVGLTTENKR